MTMTATYSPEDNKLRLYSISRLGRETYDRVKAAGFSWAPKQEVFVAPAWTPEREDLLVELCGEISDEDTSLVERAEERAERFEDYSDSRANEARQAKEAVNAIADNIPLGQPILVGHHSEKRARKDAERIENGMRRAVKLWETSKYWLDRAQGAISHAKYKEVPAVRARRIKGLEADKRKRERQKDRAETMLKLWDNKGSTLTLKQALAIANVSQCGGLLLQNGEVQWSAWSALNDSMVTPEYVQERRREGLPKVIEHENRWLSHLENRLAYERAMLTESGGTAADKVKPEKGGACRCWASPGYGRGWSYIKKVNKVSVTVEDNWGNGGPNFTRTIPFDKLKGIMTKADVDAARADGRLVENEQKGFFLTSETPQVRETPKPSQEDTEFQTLSDQAKDGVKVVSAPQLFPTPPELAARLVQLAEIEEYHSVLEPSAGMGNLLAAIWKGSNRPCTTAVEINPALADSLVGKAHLVRCGDFLSCNGDLGKFDRVVMNPPFEKGQDIRHIEHALTFLKPGGRLVAICANGPRQQEKLMPIAHQWIDLPAGSFEASGTMVNAAIIVIQSSEKGG